MPEKKSFSAEFTKNFEVNLVQIPYAGTWYIRGFGNVDFTTITKQKADHMLEAGGENFKYFKRKSNSAKETK